MKNNFHESADAVIKWIVDYQNQIETYPVLSPVRPGDILKQIPDSPPTDSDSFTDILDDFKRVIVPGITHWQHPKFFGYFPANSSPPSVLAEMLTAAMGVQGMSWATSPAATELEIKVMAWLRDMLGLPNEFSGVIQDSASAATTVAMLVAREQASDHLTNEHGLQNRQLVAYCSSEAHSSVEKAAMITGIGRQNLRKIAVNESQEMRIDLLEQAIQADLSTGKTPFLIVGAFGTTSSTATDDLSAIHRLAKRFNLWFHVDAAYAGSALVLPELRHLADGIEAADSIVINPHKWLLTTFDCSAFFIRHPRALLRSLSLLPEYLKTQETEEVVNFRDWGLGLGRRFRALKLWFVLRWYGTEGIRKIIRSHISLSQTMETWIEQDKNFEVVSIRKFNLVCFRLLSPTQEDNDALNMKLLQTLNSSGKLFLSHTKINGHIALRLVIGQTDVCERHIQESWGFIRQTAHTLLTDPSTILTNA